MGQGRAQGGVVALPDSILFPLGITPVSRSMMMRPGAGI